MTTCTGGCLCGEVRLQAAGCRRLRRHATASVIAKARGVAKIHPFARDGNSHQ